MQWWNPQSASFNVVEGQAFTGKTKSFYDRLPASAEGSVRSAVWGLSRNSTGLMIRFRTNSPSIQVRYKTTNANYALPHMPATGVSGVDLYAVSSDGEERWCAGRYAFGDTVKYNFNDLIPNDQYHKLGREYRLYLPLYNGVSWLEIGVKNDSNFEPLKVRDDRPIVVYGTSIAQGACATRPGMAWTSILGRKMDRPLINLGFSGNGRLEEEVLRPIAEIDAKVFVLDCLPNLVSATEHPDEQVAQRIKWAVKLLRDKHPQTPIALAEHAGYTEEAMNAARKSSYERVNRVLRQTFQEMKAEGIQGIYLIPHAEFKQSIETTVDGTHQSDLGMMLYAEGYEKALRTILNEPSGEFSTTRPVTQLRELPGYDWEARHRQVLNLNRSAAPDILMIGNSITNFWGGEPRAYRAYGPEAWKKVFAGKKVHNLGFGWDRIENVLWRTYHGELDGFQAKKIFLMIGTNNFQLSSDEEIIAGWRQLIGAIKARQSGAVLHLTGVYPRRNQEERVARLNIELARLAGDFDCVFIDPGKNLLGQNGKIVEDYFSDGLHPNEKGYQQMVTVYKSYVDK
ncbi:SGNH/GDSL hydrolase family protein [Ravibacter arvi]|uniref:SGNH/GDSL hydrolase family protein n=2 Tax=Ravibacter arvi TaxID=2051041 RepID=A0ABP8M8N7_9BACT